MVWFLFFCGAFALYWGGNRLVTAGLRAAIGHAVRGAPRYLPSLSLRLSWVCALTLLFGCAATWVGLGNPVYGLAVLLLVPFGLPWWVRHLAGRQADAMDVSAISYFHALRGLVQAGLGLPYAFFRLTEAVPSPFSQALRPFLDRFEDGRSLDHCLDRFRQRLDLQLTGICLSVLQMAYREGLPVAPFLERMLPLLEADREGRERVASLRRSVAVQAAVAFGTPWFLVMVLAFFQPEMTSHFWTVRALGLVAGALFLEGIGVWVLWKVSTFC